MEGLILKLLSLTDIEEFTGNQEADYSIKLRLYSRSKIYFGINIHENGYIQNILAHPVGEISQMKEAPGYLCDSKFGFGLTKKVLTYLWHTCDVGYITLNTIESIWAPKSAHDTAYKKVELKFLYGSIILEGKK